MGERGGKGAPGLSTERNLFQFGFQLFPTPPSVSTSKNGYGVAFFCSIGSVNYRAGHFQYFLIFSIMQKIIFCSFYQVILTGSRPF